MKKMFTKLSSLVLLSGLLLVGFNSIAQTTPSPTATTFASADVKTNKKFDAAAPETKAAAKPADADTSWKPQRRIWGYAFGDFYYAAHADADIVTATGVAAASPSNRGPETNYSGVPTYRNAFQFRRIYLGYDYEITKKFKAEFLLASEPGASTGVNGATSIQNGDNLVDSKMAFYIKNINLRYRDLWNGTDFVIGEMATPGFAMNEPGTNGPSSLSESTWGNRFIEKTVADFHKTNSYDVGAALEGTFDPKTKNFGYVIMLGNNSTANLLSAASANTGFYKIIYGDIWAKFLDKHLLIDIYADNVRTGAATSAIGGQSHGMFKGFVSYTMPKLTIGVEAYTQKLTNGVGNTTTKLPEDATAQALSIFVKGPIIKDKLSFFARYDSYNPDTKYISGDSYSATAGIFSSYTPAYKEQFYTAGVDITPAKNVHFSPNIWLVDYKDQKDNTVATRITDDHTLVYRLTFYYVFGK